MTDATSPPAATGFRPLRVVARVAETTDVTSFWLAPEEPDGWRDFQAGQFLSFRLPSQDARGKMLRNYSLASSPHETGSYQICIRREAPADGRGQGSGFFHDHVQVGTTLLADGPRGNFQLRPGHAPVLLVSADIGITPLVAMLRVLATDPARPVIFLHECETSAAHIMRDTVARLAAAAPHVRTASFYRAENSELTAAAMHALRPGRECDIYLCGPTPFMQRTYGLLRATGVALACIAVEFFGPLRDLERDWQASLNGAKVVP